jgi:RNA polymerase sigma factor (sigma-70 family)
MAVPADHRRRSERAFERLYRRHVGDVYRYALAVLANPADAEDVTQTAFLNAYRAFRSGQRPQRPLNWLIAITHNVCRQRFRDEARHPQEIALGRDLAVPDHSEDAGFGPEDIRRALSQLGFSQRSALAMRELEGRSYKEIAQVLGLTEAAVETLIFRARRAFREQLESSLTCSEAELAISLQLDGMLPRSKKPDLRAHLRVCTECTSLARRLRAQRSALRGIALVPLPQSLASFSSPGAAGVVGGAALGTGVGIKVAALGVAALVTAGVSTEVVRHRAPTPKPVGAAAAAVAVAVSPSVHRAPRPASAPVAARPDASPVELGAAASVRNVAFPRRTVRPEKSTRLHGRAHRQTAHRIPARHVVSALKAAPSSAESATHAGTPNGHDKADRPIHRAPRPHSSTHALASRATHVAKNGRPPKLKPRPTASHTLLGKPAAGRGSASAKELRAPTSSPSAAGPPKGAAAGRPGDAGPPAHAASHGSSSHGKP